MAKSYDEIISDIQENYKYFQGQADRFKRLLDAAMQSSQSINKSNSYKMEETLPVSLSEVNEINEVPKNSKFSQVVLKALSDGIPKSTRELNSIWEQEVGKKQEVKNISARLGNELKAKGIIKNYKKPEWPIEVRFWWGLNDWFDGESLKPEYEEKVLRKIKNSVNGSNALIFS